jgi:hypothetical protein
MDKGATVAADTRRCLFAWLLFVMANVLALFLGIAGVIPLWFGAIPGESLRSVGWYPRGPDASFAVGMLLWGISGVVVVWFGAKGAGLIRRNFLR